MLVIEAATSGAVVIDFGELRKREVRAWIRDFIRFLDRREKEMGAERQFRGRCFAPTDRCAGDGRSGKAL